MYNRELIGNNSRFIIGPGGLHVPLVSLLFIHFGGIWEADFLQEPIFFDKEYVNKSSNFLYGQYSAFR